MSLSEKLKRNLKKSKEESAPVSVKKLKTTEKIVYNAISLKYVNLMNKLTSNLENELKICKLTNVPFIYNPLEYAFEMHSNFAKKFLNENVPILFLGMNPGPWGMCQTGIPFGEINIVKDWLQITGQIDHPKKECEFRKVLGLECQRSEISGKRLWGYFKSLCNTPENFFRSAFVYNHCPLAFLSKTGTNVTPKELEGKTSNILKICDDILLELITLLNIKIVIGLGRYAEKRARDLLKNNQLDKEVNVIFMAHPSPRAVNNTNWSEKVEECLKEKDLMKYFK